MTFESFSKKELMIRLVGNSRNILLLIALSCYSLISMSQSFEDIEKEKIVIEVRKQLVALASPEGDLSKVCSKNKISGDFVVDLTVGAKGKVLTVFMVSSAPESISNQNFLKSVL